MNIYRVTVERELDAPTKEIPNKSQVLKHYDYYYVANSFQDVSERANNVLAADETLVAIVYVAPVAAILQ